MKNPDEIKACLAACPESSCLKCPYALSFICREQAMQDALALIQQLEAVQDALMRDLPISRCSICVHCYDDILCDVPPDERDDWLEPCKHFKWRCAP